MMRTLWETCAFVSVALLSTTVDAGEIAVTGNQEHRRIFREAFKTTVDAGQRNLESGDPQV